MMILARLFGYVALGALGCAVVPEDVAVGKIRNRLLLWSAAACSACYALYCALTLAGQFGWFSGYLVGAFYRDAALHIGVSFTVAVCLWLCDIWPAGDAKFFIVCAAFVPVLEPELAAAHQYLVVMLLANTFVLAALYVLLAAAFSGLRIAASLGSAVFLDKLRSLPARGLELVRAGWVRRLELSALVLNMTGLFAGQLVLRQALAGTLVASAISPAITCVALFLLWEKLSRYLSSWRLARDGGVFVLIAGLAVYFWRPAAVSTALMRSLAPLTGFGLLVIAARLALDRALSGRALQIVDGDGLKTGMFPSQRTLTLLRRDQDYFDEHFGVLFKDGFTAPQVTALKQWLLGLPKEQASVEVVRGIPFATWIFGGALFTLAARMDAARWFLSLWRGRGH